MTYEYECKNCNHEWQTEQKITEDAVKDCPSCNQATAVRLISSGNFILKGGSWAKEGYK